MVISKSVEPMYAAFGMFLRGERLARQMKQSQVARHLGITKSTITNYEHGYRRIPLVSFVRWCQVLGLDPADTLATVQRAMDKREKDDRAPGSLR